MARFRECGARKKGQARPVESVPCPLADVIINTVWHSTSVDRGDKEGKEEEKIQ